MFKIREFSEIETSFYNALVEQFPGIKWGTESNAYKIMYPIMREIQLAEERQQSYIDKNNYLKAEGQDLDLLLQNRDFPRRQASKSKGYWETINSIPGTSALAGEVKFEDDQGVTFVNIESFTVNDNGVAEILIECEEVGEIGNAKENTINRIKTPIRGLVSGTNKRTFEGGTDTETDTEYRWRWERTKNSTAFWNTEGIRMAIMEVNGVKSCKVLENDEDYDIEIDGSLMPSRSRRYYVDGGAEADIAKAIYLKTDRAIKETGKIEIGVLDTQNEERIVKFSRPKYIKIYSKIIVEGSIDTTAAYQLIDEYIKESVIGSNLSSFDVVEIIRHTIGVNQVKNLEVHFSKDNTNFFSYLKLEDFEKGVV